MDNHNAPKKRGPKPKPALPDKHRKAVTKAVASGDPMAIERAMAQANQTPCLYNQKITDAHLEAVLTRLAGGESLRSICESLGISAALVRKRAYDDPHDFGEAMSAANRIAADQSFDQQLVVAYDMTIPAPDKKIIIDVLDRRAKAHNRAAYGDKIAVGIRSEVNIILNDDDRRLT